MIAGRGVHLPRDSPVSPPTRMPLSQMFLKPWGAGECPNFPRILHLCTRKFNRTCGGTYCRTLSTHLQPRTASEDLYPSPTRKTTLRPGLLLDPQKTVTGRQVSGRHCPNEEMETQKPPGLIQHRVQRARGWRSAKQRKKGGTQAVENTDPGSSSNSATYSVAHARVRVRLL